MAMVSKAVLDDIRFRCDIVDVIDSYITLPKKGTVVKALCPFHKEKSPSFTINRQRQIFHCFGCGAGGDVFKFVMLYDHVDFPGAIKILAEKAGIVLEFEKGSEPSTDREMLLALHEDVATLYHRELLKTPEAQPARDYLRKRSLTKEIAQDFMIGYAPDRWDFVIEWARRKGIAMAKLELAGLVVKREEGGPNPYYDRFRGRVMFPIRNEAARIVGFSGRTLLPDAKGAKYVNSPETPIFRKSRLLYALDRARRQIVDAREAIVCEGQIDVIRCHSAGFTTAVASQGTAFTEEHAAILKRYADGVVLVFDSDEAGRNAAIKTAIIFIQAGLAVRVASLPPGEDPDSLILKQGAEGFAAVLAAAVPVVDFQLNILLEREDIGTELGMMKVSREILATISHNPNAVQRDLLLRTAAGRLGVAPLALQAELNPLLKKAAPRPTATPTAPAPVATASRSPFDRMLAEHLGAMPELIGLVEHYLPYKMIQDPLCRAFVELVRDSVQGGLDLMQLVAERDDGDRTLSGFAAQVFTSPQKGEAEGAHEVAVKDLILRFWRTELQRRRSEIEHTLTATTDEATREELGAQTAQLTTDLNRLRRWETGEPVLHFYAETPAT